MTAKAAGAIGSIQLAGKDSRQILQKNFKPKFGKCCFDAGQIYVGFFTAKDEKIDEVVIGCEQHNSFAINCHGNPLIVEMIMEELTKQGAVAVNGEKMTELLTQNTGQNKITAEAATAMLKAQTIEAARTIDYQTKIGLANVCKWWLQNIDKMDIEDIKIGAVELLEQSERAKLIIDGIKAVLAGPPNSGKSSLLNALCGREKAVVSDIAGTTRDWVCGCFEADGLAVELIDTAGLDEKIAAKSNLDNQAQQIAADITGTAEIVLYVIDGTDPESPRRH